MNRVKFKFKTGQKVIDRVSNFKGVIDSLSIWYDGQIKYSVQSQEGDNKDSYWIDEYQLKKDGFGSVLKGVKKVEFKFSNGQKVKDLSSGIEGIIEICSYWISGCIKYYIQPAVEEGKSEKPTALWLPEANIGFIDDGLRERYEVMEKKKVGGPSMSSSDAKKI